MVLVLEGWVDTINLVDRVIKEAAMDSMAPALAEATMAATTTVEDGGVITRTKYLRSLKGRSNVAVVFIEFCV